MKYIGQLILVTQFIEEINVGQWLGFYIVIMS